MQSLLISRPAKQQSSHSIVMLAVWELHCLIGTTALLDVRHDGHWVSFRTCLEPRCNAIYWPSLSLQHHSQTKTVRLCHVSIWQPTQCTLQSAVASEARHLVLEILGTQSCCCWHDLIQNHWHTSTHFVMWFCVRVCLIWILYEYNWRSFFKILWMDDRERPNSWQRLRSDFFGLHPTESFTASTFSGDLAVSFLPLVDFCRFLVDFINVPVSLNVFTQQVIWNLGGHLLKLNLL